MLFLCFSWEFCVLLLFLWEFCVWFLFLLEFCVLDLVVGGVLCLVLVLSDQLCVWFLFSGGFLFCSRFCDVVHGLFSSIIKPRKFEF